MTRTADRFENYSRKYPARVFRTLLIESVCQSINSGICLRALLCIETYYDVAMNDHRALAAVQLSVCYRMPPMTDEW